MLSQIRPALVLLTLLTLITGLIYPLIITGIAQIALPQQANGSIVFKDGAVGSALIGQNFASSKYFHGRPSATSATDPNDDTKTIDAPYNAANSTGSNLGPTSQKLVDRIKADIETLHASVPVPADALTTSASGLDPDISPENARVQIETVAKARNLAVEKVQTLVAQQIRLPVLGLFGEPRVNVLMLNIALDAL